MTKKFEDLPRNKRWSYSRIMSFTSCPRKHHYSYVEEIRGKDNIHLVLGDYWHRLMEAYNKEEDYEKIIEEYEKAVNVGAIDQDIDLLRYVFNEYVQWYPKDDVLLTEQSFYEEWEDGDHATFKVDCVYNKDGLNILRDYKTTTKDLKYDINSVRYNQQLLLYKPIVEDATQITIHGIEIDEVKLAMCMQPPLNKNGMPTADIRRLGLVKYDTYLNLLEEMGIDERPEYQHILTTLENRGHPLFRRVTVDVDDVIVGQNLEDVYGLYKLAKTEGVKSRNRTVLCNYCEYKQLCDADYLNIDEESRQIIIDKLKSS